MRWTPASGSLARSRQTPRATRCSHAASGTFLRKPTICLRSPSTRRSFLIAILFTTCRPRWRHATSTMKTLRTFWRRLAQRSSTLPHTPTPSWRKKPTRRPSKTSGYAAWKKSAPRAAACTPCLPPAWRANRRGRHRFRPSTITSATATGPWACSAPASTRQKRSRTSGISTPRRYPRILRRRL